MPTGRDLHHDTPLGNFAVQAFASSQTYVAPRILPVVPVPKQSDRYYVLDRDSWLMMPQTAKRAPKTAPRRVDWRQSSNAYYCDNYALANEISKEDLANADTALMTRQRAVEFTTEMLLRDYEQRVATLFTAFGNYNAYTSLSAAADRWSATASADIMAQVGSAHAYIRRQTGIRANTIIMDWDSYANARRNTRLAEHFKYTEFQGQLSDGQLRSVFDVQNIVVADGIKNTATLKAGTSVYSGTNIWGSNAVLCHLAPATSLKAMTFAAAFRWSPAGVAAPFSVFRYDDPDPGRKVEVVEVGYYQDERIIAADLGYLIANT